MAEFKNYTCPCCAAPVAFDGTSQKLKCQYCGSEFNVEDILNMEKAEQEVSTEKTYDWEHYEQREYGSDEVINLSEYTCSGCGAEIYGEDTTGATICPYCGNSAIVKKQFEGGLKPDYVIPFAVPKDAALQILKKSCKGKRLLPKHYIRESKMENVKGVYVPFWVYDCNVDGDATYDATRVTTWSDSKYNYTKTDHFYVMRKGKAGFCNVPVDGSEKADDAYMEAIEPYDYSKAVNFDTAYLSGYLANKYDYDNTQCIDRANARVDRSTQELLRSTVTGYASVTENQSGVRSSDGKVRYAFLPVWMFNVRYRDKNYNYAINGQTGKIAGEYPISKGRYWAYLLGISGISSILLYALYYFLFMR